MERYVRQFKESELLNEDISNEKYGKMLLDILNNSNKDFDESELFSAISWIMDKSVQEISQDLIDYRDEIDKKESKRLKKIQALLKSIDLSKADKIYKKIYSR